MDPSVASAYILHYKCPPYRCLPTALIPVAPASAACLPAASRMEHFCIPDSLRGLRLSFSRILFQLPSSCKNLPCKNALLHFIESITRLGARRKFRLPYPLNILLVQLARWRNTGKFFNL